MPRLIIYLFAVLVILGLTAALVASASSVSYRPAHVNNQLRSSPEMVDRLHFIETADEFSTGIAERIVVECAPSARITLADKSASAWHSGVWTSPEIAADFPFTEALPSWNASTNAQSGLVLELRRVRQNSKWSPWLFGGSYGRILPGPSRKKDFDAGRMNIDTLELKSPADAFQLRVTLQSFDPQFNPSVRRVALCYSGAVADESMRRRLVSPATQPEPQDWARDLPVPFRPQGADNVPRPIWSEICSPTSTSMVMEYSGVNVPTFENALAIYDPVYDLYGNWSRAVARAGEMGLDAWLTRFRTWDQVKAAIAAGQPIIASIQFNKGECKGFLYDETAGHLLVIRGLTPEGDCIINDPARKEGGNRVIYKASEMQKAWLDRGGVAYIIRPAAKPTTQPAK